MFIQIIQGKCTKQDECRAMGDRWVSEIAPGAIGWLGGTYGFTDDDMFLGIVRFESKQMRPTRTPPVRSRGRGGPRWRSCSTVR